MEKNFASQEQLIYIKALRKKVKNLLKKGKLDPNAVRPFIKIHRKAMSKKRAGFIIGGLTRLFESVETKPKKNRKKRNKKTLGIIEKPTTPKVVLRKRAKN
jgi:hypothetical protein